MAHFLSQHNTNEHLRVLDELFTQLMRDGIDLSSTAVLHPGEYWLTSMDVSVKSMW
jgi:hypothetical protein